MKSLSVLTALLMLVTHAAIARPILSDSQQSYASVCLADAEPARRLAAICEVAVADAGIAPSDLRDMRTILAGAYDRLGKPGQARTLLDDVLADDPFHTAALNRLGWLHWDADSYDAAIATFERSLETGATAQGFAGLASSGRLGDTLTEQDYLRLIDTAIAMSPDYTWAMRDKAWFYIDSARPAQAEPILQTALHVDDGDPWTLYALGAALYAQEKYAAAIDRLNRAVATGDAPTSAYLYRARANYQVGNYRRALVDAERVTRDWPEASDGPVWKARALSALGLRPAGITILREFLTSGHDTFATYWLADLLYYGEEEDEAIRVLRRNTDDAGDYYDHEFMAMMLLEQERYADARPHIDAALTHDPEAHYPVYYAALIDLSAGELDRAEALFLQALAQGLPRRHIRTFIGAMTEVGAFDRAIAFRNKANRITADP